jgi:hypothetical protein
MSDYQFTKKTEAVQLKVMFPSESKNTSNEKGH